MISGVIVTRNAQYEIFDCLESLQGFADELVVIDLESSDLTLEIAAKFEAKIFKHASVPFVEKVRQFAINKATGDRVILLDPDERLSEALKLKLKEIPPNIAAVNIPRKNIFFGNWVRHSNFWPDRQIRFFNKNSISWPEKIHTYPSIKGSIINLDADEKLAMIHKGYKNYSEFFDRQNRYSNAATGEFSYFNLFWQPLREFLVRFVKHQGFMDGFLGLSLTYSLMIYQLMVQIKLWEKTRNSS